MTTAELAKQFGGSEVGDTTPMATSATPAQVSAPTQNIPQPNQNPAQLAAQLGGHQLGSDQDSGDGKNFIQKVGDFFTGNTQKFGADAGAALAAPGNADLYTQAVKDYTDVNNNLLKAIAIKKAAGQDVTQLQNVLQQHIADAPKLENFTGDVINKSNEQILGEAGGTALEALSGGTLGAFDAPEGASALSKIGRASAVGAGYGAVGGATNAMQNNASVADVATQAVEGAGTGAVVGGGVSGAAEGAAALLKDLPTRLVQNAIPGLDKEGAQYALDTKPIGTVKKLFLDSVSAVKSLNGQIDAILQHPEYSDFKIGGTGTQDINGTMVNSNGIIQSTLDSFPQSNYTQSDIVKAIKKLVPEKAKLVDKIVSGDATLMEANELKKAIYPKVRKVFTDLSNPTISAQKQIGATFSTAIADTIKSFVPETEPIFQKMSKEINLRDLLGKTFKKQDSQKILGLYDLASLGIGNSVGGIPGALATEAGSKLAKNPAVKFAGAKIINAVAEAPGLKAVINNLNTKL